MKNAKIGYIEKTDAKGMARVPENGAERVIRLVGIAGISTRPSGKQCLILNTGPVGKDVAIPLENDDHKLEVNDIKINNDKSSIYFDSENDTITIEAETVIIKVKEHKIEADEINIKTDKFVVDSKETEMTGSDFKIDTDKVAIKGTETKVDATTLELKGTGETKMETATLDIKANASAKITSAKTEVTGIFDVKGILANNGFDVGNTHMHPTAPIGPPSPPTPVPVG